MHKKAILAKGASNIGAFFTATMGENSISEATLVYHSVKHGLSYYTTDCIVKLNRNVFSDSTVAKTMHLGRTKAEMIQGMFWDLKPCATFYLSPTDSEPVYFSVATDASNKGNRKIFLASVRHFSAVDGVQSKLLDFYEDSDEMANGMRKALMTCIEVYELNVQNSTAYPAVNYWRNHSVYKLFCCANERILKANCPAHIAHNACKHACDQLSADIETIVYSHFSISASWKEELRSFFAFVDTEWHEILCHVCTRRLSLHRAVSCLLESWPALTSYLHTFGETCPVALKRIFQKKTDTAEIYLSFFHNVWCVFDQLVKKL